MTEYSGPGANPRENNGERYGGYSVRLFLFNMRVVIRTTLPLDIG
jgi:hypothetical protein